jgi:large subunit ribosomal protein L13
MPTTTPKKYIKKVTAPKVVKAPAVFTLDAAEQSLGRLASQIAKLLRGKNEASWQPHLTPTNKVIVNNVGLLKISVKKGLQKTYFQHSGYPGSDRQPTLNQIVSKKGYQEILRVAVRGMLPANRLRPIMLKNLIIKD